MTACHFRLQPDPTLSRWWKKYEAAIQRNTHRLLRIAHSLNHDEGFSNLAKDFFVFQKIGGNHLGVALLRPTPPDNI